MLRFLMIGQSNMAGRGTMGMLPAIVNDRVRVYWNGEWRPAAEPVNPDRSFSGESMQLPFADIVQRATGEDVGLIACAEGGTLLRQWAPGGGLFTRAVAAARATAGEGLLSAILWIQGENDGYSLENAGAYSGRFLAMLDALTAELELTEKVPVIIAELCPFLDEYNRQVPPEQRVPYWCTIAAQQRQLPLLRSNIRCVSSEGLEGKPDGIHYDTPALRELGRRFAEMYITEFRKEGDCTRAVNVIGRC